MMGRPRKYTKNEAIELAQELIEWLKEDKNVFITKFMAGDKGLSRQQVKLLREYYEEFDELMDKAKSVQEGKLLDLGARNRLNAAVVIFALKNLHDYMDKKEVKQEITQHTYTSKEVKEKSTEELQDMLLNLTKKPSLS